MKIAHNTCFGGFSLSKPVEDIYNQRAEAAGMEEFCAYYTPRHCTLLVELIEKYGDDANGGNACLDITEIEGDQYRIDNFDGREIVYTPATEVKHTYITVDSQDNETPEEDCDGGLSCECTGCNPCHACEMGKGIHCCGL
jgi:hypothetical protein